MSNPLAVNAVVPKAIDSQYYLRASKNGFPINGQVPRTYQMYTGTGNQTINYDGSNEIRIFGQTLTGPLVINFGPLRNLINWIGRTVTLNIVAPINQTITLSSPVFLMVNGTALQQLSHVIPADGNSKSITLYFHSSSNINVDYGASSGSIVAAGITFNNLGAGSPVYRDTTGSTVNLRSMLAANRSLLVTSNTTNVNFTSNMVYGGNALEYYNYGNSVSELSAGNLLMYNPTGTAFTISSIFPTYSNVTGGLSISTPNVSGINPSLSVVYIPAPRMNRSQTIPITFARGAGDLLGNMTLEMIPAMERVWEEENVLCADPSDTTIKFYDLTTPNSELRTGVFYIFTLVTVRTDVPPSVICTDLQDNFIFYVPDSDPTKVYVSSTSRSAFFGSFSDVLVLDTSLVPGFSGQSVIGMCYDEVSSTLYILPNKVSGNILALPILPHLHDAVNFPLCTVGTVREIRFDGSVPAGALFSMCLLNNTGDFCISYEDGNTKIGVFRIDTGSGTVSQSYAWDTGSSGAVSLMCSSRGRIIAQYSSDQQFYATTPGLGINGGFTPLYTATKFYPSLTINCYNNFGF